MIYADQAATSFPKPSCVVEAVATTLRKIPGSPGRSGHKGSLDAGRIIFETRERLANFFGIEDSSRFIFTSGATESLNIVIQGVLTPGDTVLATHMEHNSVARPLEELRKERGITIHYIPCSSEGLLDLNRFEEMLYKLRPKLVCINHVSNVTGTIQPLSRIAELKGDALLLVDGAQSVGHIEINLKELSVDFLAFSGHKGLFAPTGVGVLYIQEDLEDLVRPLKFGGTGSRSEALVQPEFLPDRFESGTPNLPGIAGLGAGLDYVSKIGLDQIRTHEKTLSEIFIKTIEKHPKIRIYGPRDRLKATGIISINIEGLSPSEVALRLDRDFGVMVRPGLQCAPLAHQTLGSMPQGTVRFSFNYLNRIGEAKKAGEAVLEIAESS